MRSDVDKLLQAVADTLGSRKHHKGKGFDRDALDRNLKELSTVPGLDPKEAASKITQLLIPPTPRPQALSLVGPIALGATVAVILSVILSFFIASVVLKEWIRNDLMTEVRSYLDTYTPPSIPTTLELKVDPPSLPADGVSKTRIQVTVLDQFGLPVPDGTEVDFRSTSPDKGAVQPSRVATINGQAKTVFRAGQVPGEVQIVVRVGQRAQQRVSIQLTEVAKPKLGISVSTVPEQKIERGGRITFTFSIANNGEAPATDVVILSKIPTGTTFLTASDQGRRNPEGLVVWRVGVLAPGQMIQRTLTVTVQENLPIGTIITNADYWVRYGRDSEVRGQQQVSLEVEETAMIPARVELSVNPEVLPADGLSTASITARVFDRLGNRIIDSVPVVFALQPPEGGRISPAAAPTIRGEINATFTAGMRPGEVVIIAMTKAISSKATIQLTQVLAKRGKIKDFAAHLYAEPVENANQILIFQLPQDTPIQLLDHAQNGFQKVAISVWVPINAIDLAHAAITVGSQGLRVKVGDDPEDALNLSSAKREIKAAAEGVSVQILDKNSKPDFVRIRIVGWMPVDSIEESE